MRKTLWVCIAAAVCGCGDDGEEPPALPTSTWADGRTIVSLNGDWDVRRDVAADTPPAMEYAGKTPVPGLLTAAQPAFDGVGTDADQDVVYWLRRSFEVTQTGDIALLRIHKSKYGAKVWVNGEDAGENPYCFSMGEFDVTSLLKPGETNTVDVQLGARREHVASGIAAGQDAEKDRWIPGIYDDVEIVITGSPRIVRVKIEPDLEAGEARVLTTVKNDHEDARAAIVWSAVGAEELTEDVQLDAGQEKTVEQRIPIADVRLWSPDDPFLYVLKSEVRQGTQRLDALETRFGMRTVQWRGGDDGGFFLNGQRLYLRGSNITLHRFFEDELATTQAWDRDWVRKLMTGAARELHWNSYRISVGRAPRFWYDIADEEGFLLADEFMMWTLIDSSHEDWDVDHMVVEFTSWVQQSWNHPSIAWWDASNETSSELSTEAVERVRGLDPTRQWENGGYNPPQSADDPVEDHPYLFLSFGGLFTSVVTKIDEQDGQPPAGGIPSTNLGTYDAEGHPYIINEYAWLWINRDATPTTLTKAVYEDLLGEGPFAPEVYRETYGYLAAGLTAFWRAQRGYAGVQHFTHLTYSREDGETCDNFLDLDTLELEPRWRHYAAHAFAPVMVYIDAWHEDYPPGDTVQVPVQAINDHPTAQSASVRVLAVDDDGAILTAGEPKAVTLEAFGADRWDLALEVPALERFLLVAELTVDGESPVISRRKIGYEHIGEKAPDPPYGP